MAKIIKTNFTCMSIFSNEENNGKVVTLSSTNPNGYATIHVAIDNEEFTVGEDYNLTFESVMKPKVIEKSTEEGITD